MCSKTVVLRTVQTRMIFKVFRRTFASQCTCENKPVLISEREARRSDNAVGTCSHNGSRASGLANTCMNNSVCPKRFLNAFETSFLDSLHHNSVIMDILSSGAAGTCMNNSVCSRRLLNIFEMSFLNSLHHNSVITITCFFNLGLHRHWHGKAQCGARFRSMRLSSA